MTNVRVMEHVKSWVRSALVSQPQQPQHASPLIMYEHATRGRPIGRLGAFHGEGAAPWSRPGVLQRSCRFLKCAAHCWVIHFQGVLPSYLQQRSIAIVASACSRQPLMLAPHCRRAQLI